MGLSLSNAIAASTATDGVPLSDGEITGSATVPKSGLFAFDATDIINLVFTNGVYEVAPFLGDAFFYVGDTVFNGGAGAATTP